MTIDEAIADLTMRIKGASPGAVIRVQKRSGEEVSIRIYAPTVDESVIKEAT
jgi:hypothetical protein